MAVMVANGGIWPRSDLPGAGAGAGTCFAKVGRVWPVLAPPSLMNACV